MGGGEGRRRRRRGEREREDVNGREEEESESHGRILLSWTLPRLSLRRPTVTIHTWLLATAAALFSNAKDLSICRLLFLSYIYLAIFQLFLSLNAAVWSRDSEARVLSQMSQQCGRTSIASYLGCIAVGL